MKTDEQLQRECIEKIISEIPLKETVGSDNYEHDIYAEYAVIYLLAGKEIEEANKHIARSARYMQLPHPTGRDVRGECDFAALRLIIAMNLVADKITDENKKLIKHFLLEEKFESMYGSENHVFMKRIIRLLAAEYYHEDFKQYGMTWQEAFEADKKYILDFIRFRVKYGIGEFTSSYLDVDIFMTSALYHYSRDEEIKRAAIMFNDILAFEAFNNSDNDGYLYGAVGRTYPVTYAYTGHSISNGLKKLIIDREARSNQNFAIAPYTVDDFVREAIITRSFPCEIKERKHLHSMNAWRSDIPDKKRTDRLLECGGIDKYTYITPEYGIGAIVHQDDYPVDATDDSRYAHHQQVEWSCVFPDKDRDNATKLFSSHPGTIGEHNKWTGDLDCCCVKSFSTKDTAGAVYNITHEDQLQYTHLFIQPERFDKSVFKDDRVYLYKNGCSVCVFLSGAYELLEDEQFDCHELRIAGKKTAYLLHIEKTDFDEFIEKTDKVKFAFDEETLTVSMDGFSFSWYDNDHEAYKNVYDAPWLRSEWGKANAEMITDNGSITLDFDKLEVIK